MSVPAPVADSKQVDQTKAIAIPILGIITLILGGYITRSQFISAAGNCRSDFRLTIIFGASLVSALLSVFLFPTSGFEYGLLACVFSYSTALLVAPGMMEAIRGKLFLASWAWFLILVGIPDLWNTGIVAQVTGTSCSDWFKTNNDKMCKGSWLTFVVLCAIIIIIMNLFSLLMVTAYVFDADIDASMPIRGGYGSSSTNEGSYQPVGGETGGGYAAVGEDKPQPE